MTDYTFQSKPGREGWAFDQSDLAYNADVDANNNSVSYDGLGTATEWNYQSKS